MQKRFIFWVIAVVMLVAGGNVLADDVKPSGKIVIDETQVMVLIGGAIGGGTLLLGDDSHSFRTDGLKFGGVGVQKVHITGDVYHLKEIKDFPGTYIETEADVSVGKGTGYLWMKNRHGVILSLKTSSQGLALSLAGEGLKISMD